MKQKLTIAAIALVAMLFPTVAKAQNVQHTPPDKATWAITGDMRAFMQGGTPVYELNNPDGIRPNGYIKFKSQLHYYGTSQQGEQVVFSLENAETDRPNKFKGAMHFWSWNDVAGEWQLDEESGSGRREYENSSIASVMLVLDYSGSMGNDIGQVKRAAKSFLKKMLDVSEGKGNVRVGVIGFNTVEFSKTHTMEPMPLTQRNYLTLCSFIDGMDAIGGTALYYSVNAAAEILQRDFAQNIQGKKFGGAAIVAFTDGHDNTSTDESKGYVSSKDYFNYTKGYFPKQMVNGMDILSWCVGNRGSDITSDNIWNATKKQFTEVFDYFIPIEHIEDLNDRFDYIATSLIERNTVLNLRVARGISGPVAWTFDDEEYVYVSPTPQPKPLPKPSGENKFWLGVGLEGGGAFCRYREYGWWYNSFEGQDEWVLREEGSYLYPYIGVNIDAAFHLSSKFAIGASGSFMMTSNIDPGFKVGPLIKYTFNNNSALLVGAGMKMWFGDFYLNDIDLYLSLGWKFKSRWYVTANAGLYSYGLSVGYSIFDN